MIRSARQELEERLRRAGLPEPEADAELLLAHVLGTSLGGLRARGGDPFPETARERLEPLIERRLRREPVQYLLGSWPFLDCELEVGPGVLIPRPETEEWVDRLCRLISRRFEGGRFRFSDIGTGTGAIGIALGKRFPAACGILVDRSRQALTIAAGNARRNGLGPDRFVLVESDLLDPLASGMCDLIVSNPPYIARSDLPGLQPEVGRFEPAMALDGGPRGIELPIRLLQQLPRVLRPGGIAALEHGHGQRAELIAAAPSPLTLLEAGTDFGDRERWLFWSVRESVQSAPGRAQ